MEEEIGNTAGAIWDALKRIRKERFSCVIAKASGSSLNAHA